MYLMININQLKERASFIFGDRDVPIPGRLCLFKLSEKYKSRKNCPYLGDYILAKTIILNNNKLYLLFENFKKDGYFKSLSNKSTSIYNEEFFDYWIYVDDINKLVEGSNNGN